MLHIHVTTSQNFETEGTQQLFCVFMDGPEVSLYVREEGGPVIADLWISEADFESECRLSFKRKERKKEMKPRVRVKVQTWHT